LYAGRLIKEKGILNLTEAFLKLQLQYNKIRLVIAGDGNLLIYITENYHNDKIDILGRLSFEQMKSLYHQTDIFVYPSLFPEGLPTSILEAGLIGCAVVATPRGGTEEVIINKDYGLIVDGTTENLYQSLKLLLDDEKLRKTIGQNISKRVKKYFSWNEVAKVVDKQIKELEDFKSE
jgi:glycosyltransferase involved in cell wall biosynthesis